MRAGERCDALVSVVVPACNCAAYLGEALDSLLAQTHRHLEVIVVDDGSTDGTACMADRYARRDRRVTVIHTSNRGPSAARNTGLVAATGEWVWFVDADDVVRPDAVELLVRAAAGHDVAVANVVPFDERGALPRTHCLPEPFPYEDLSDGEGLLRNVFRSALGGFTWQYFMSRPLLRSMEGEGPLFDEDIRLYEDMLFSLRLGTAAHSVSYVSEPLYFYRQVPTSAAHTLVPSSARQGMRAVERVERWDVPQELVPARRECACRLYLYLYGSREGSAEMTALRREIRTRLLGYARGDTQGLSRTVRVKLALLRLNLLAPALRAVRMARRCRHGLGREATIY